MTGESKTELAEQRAFATSAVNFVLTAVCTGLTVSGTYVLTPLLAVFPGWLRYILALSAAAGILHFLWLFVRLGGAATGSEHRAWYADFRSDIATGHAGGHYARGVTRAIAWSDRFFGDEGKADKGIFPRAFGLKEAAPLWTANSYDRCLLLALVYPFATIALFWTIWGHVGQAEEALMMREAPVHGRILALTFTAFFIFASIRGWHAKGIYAKILWWGLAFSGWVATLGFGDFSFISTTIGIFAITISTSAFLAIFHIRFRAYVASRVKEIKKSGIHAIALIISFFMSMRLIDFLIIEYNLYTGNEITRFMIFILLSILFCLPFYFIVYILYVFASWSAQQNKSGIYLVVFSIIMLLSIIWFFPISGKIHKDIAAILYFFGLLSLINAPFDWAAIGITRGLLRKGLEQGGGWPIVLALADFLFSLLLLALLALATLWATEIYSQALAYGGSAPVIDVGKYLTALSDPAPEYFWLYSMLFSSQIPALVNLAFGALCLLRGLPRVNGWMAAQLPEFGGISSWARLSVASAQALQLALALALGCTIYYAMAAFLIGLIDPIFGQGLLDILKTVRISPLLN